MLTVSFSLSADIFQKAQSVVAYRTPHCPVEFNQLSTTHIADCTVTRLSATVADYGAQCALKCRPIEPMVGDWSLRLAWWSIKRSRPNRIKILSRSLPFRPPDVVGVGLIGFTRYIFIRQLHSRLAHWRELNQILPHIRNWVRFENTCPIFGYLLLLTNWGPKTIYFDDFATERQI